MNEAQFREMLVEKIKEKLSNEFTFDSKKSILYKLIIDSEGKLQPPEYWEPKRGQYAFETDILVSNNNIPLVVIEIKIGGFSTHDIITYSTKALKHKEVYPYLRYGLIVGEQRSIDRKFFIHNVGFDFAIAVENIDNDIQFIADIIDDQIKTANKLSAILSQKIKLPKIVNSSIKFDT